MTFIFTRIAGQHAFYWGSENGEDLGLTSCMKSRKTADMTHCCVSTMEYKCGKP